MKASDYIAIISIVVTAVIALIGAIYTIISNSKKFEIAQSYTSEIITWYEKVVKIVIKFKEFIDISTYDKKVDLAELSALIEVGRFYFPNIKADGFGSNNPLAYRGFRHKTLEILVEIYEVMSVEVLIDINSTKEYVNEQEREFTSCVFEMLDPNKRKKLLKRYADITLNNNIGY